MLSDRASSLNLLKICTQDNDGAKSFKGLAYIPELGLRASLITDHVEDWFAKWVYHNHHHLNEDHPSGANPSSQPFLEDYDPLGLRVTVHIAYINHEDCLILKLDLTRPNFLIESTA
ncbi:hypothetical protein PCANC_12178 [Puccinia coronata f. sp. avenae]|uniref:Uncharacterized protein n=1 Tax=Puccinia coronata f. sp. avenae TaxID=200324 RepID=A0A2N5VGG6_9BASI|nr:hypothetical protein PCANC_12178 [Puccinia coronata f. sp. avenae]